MIRVLLTTYLYAGPIQTARMLGALCWITERCHTGGNAVALNYDFNAAIPAPLTLIRPIDHLFAQVPNSILGTV